MITTKNAPWSGLVDHGCGWWIDLQQDKLTETLRNALHQPSEGLAEMGKRGREWVHRDFSMEQVASHMREVYLWATKHTEKPACIVE